MIFVTGGTGLLGNCIIRHLCERGFSVRALCRRGTPRTSLDGLNIEIVEGDLSCAQTLEDAIAGCEAVIHSAALIHIGWARLEASREVNVQGTQRIAEACLRSGARLVHISTVDTLPAACDREHPIGEDGQGGIPKTACSYVVTKSEAEQVVRDMSKASGLDAVILHPGFMLGPYDWKPSSGRMMLEVCRAPLVAAPAGGCSFCDARDVAQGVVSAMEKALPGESFILAGENWSYQVLWRNMLQIAGRKKRVFRLGPAIRLAGNCIDLFHRWLPISEGDLNGAAIQMGMLNHYYSSEKARKSLGYQNRRPEETLADAWNWLQKLTKSK